MTTIAQKVIQRSSLYHLICTSSHINHSRIARKDACGGIFVMVLLVGLLNFMRVLFVAN